MADTNATTDASSSPAGSTSKGFFGNIWDSVTGVASAATSTIKSGVGAVASAVTPGDASNNDISGNAASLPAGTQVAAARYNRSVKKLKKESVKLMKVIEGKTRRTPSKGGKKADKKPKSKKSKKLKKH